MLHPVLIAYHSIAQQRIAENSKELPLLVPPPPRGKIPAEPEWRKEKKSEGGDFSEEG